jgi:phosphatidylglycerol lysyltransferase
MKKEDMDYRLSSLNKYGYNPLSYLTLADDLLIFKGEWEGYFAYKKHLNTIIILGDPIVSDRKLPDVINDIKNIFKKYHVCFFFCKKKIIETLRKEKFRGFCFGQDAIVNLNKFSLSGKKKWSIRSSINYAKKHDMIIEEYKFNFKRSSTIEKNIFEISKQWRSTKNVPELTFAFGKVDFENYRDARYFICKQYDKIVGFITYFPIYGSNRYYLDLTRRSVNSPRGTMDYLIVKSFETFKKENIDKIFIGGTPLYFHNLDKTGNLHVTETIFYILKPVFEFFYPSKSEFFFKKKYATDWEPLYLFYYPRFSIRIFLSLVNAIYEGGIASLCFYKIKHIFHNHFKIND